MPKKLTLKEQYIGAKEVVMLLDWVHHTIGWSVDEAKEAEEKGDQLKVKYFEGIGNAGTRIFDDINYLLENGKVPPHIRDRFDV
jgi:hypothetical protein